MEERNVNKVLPAIGSPLLKFSISTRFLSFYLAYQLSKPLHSVYRHYGSFQGVWNNRETDLWRWVSHMWPRKECLDEMRGKKLGLDYTRKLCCQYYCYWKLPVRILPHRHGRQWSSVAWWCIKHVLNVLRVGTNHHMDLGVRLSFVNVNFSLWDSFINATSSLTGSIIVSEAWMMQSVWMCQTKQPRFDLIFQVCKITKSETFILISKS